MKSDTRRHQRTFRSIRSRIDFVDQDRESIPSMEFASFAVISNKMLKYNFKLVRFDHFVG